MRIPFSKIFRNNSNKIPELVTRQLLSNFPEAKNIDWENKDNCFEAVFYLNDIEHIARFSKTGEMLEYKKNLWPSELPENIKMECHCSGEIMNAILITKKSEQNYEVIIRDEKLDRFVFVYTTKGELLESGPLQ